MRPHTQYEPERTMRDLADEEAQRLADRAEDFNRTYSTITTEQADDLARAMSAIKAALGRMSN